jgi:hypothetical protein
MGARVMRRLGVIGNGQTAIALHYEVILTGKLKTCVIFAWASSRTSLLD